MVGPLDQHTEVLRLAMRAEAKIRNRRTADPGGTPGDLRRAASRRYPRLSSEVPRLKELNPFVLLRVAGFASIYVVMYILIIMLAIMLVL